MNKAIPEFKNEDEERAFWATHESSEYMDWSKSNHALFPNLKPSTRAISLRLPASMLDELRQMANQRDVPYQSLIKVFLRERMDMERQRNFAVSEGNLPYKVKGKPESVGGKR
ncbi:MAG: BrnA antitoxin family protein [Anaerolineales bacterium]